ncbi:FAD/NAD(P)-binding domain-containing protein [Xylaria palmicola]|nr:FAD/NAD(P)-binding domain-containing protein [Xylaria palmicola]
MPLIRILVVGAGVCGPAFATLLRRADPDLSRFDVTVVERAPRLRDTGLQIDLRAQAIPIVRKMGLLDAIRKRAVPERGVRIVDARGRAFATFGSNDSGHGAQALTSEYEIMRGDLVDVFYRASLGLNPDREEEGGDGGNGAASGEKAAKAAATAATRHSDEETLAGSGGVRYEFGVTVTDLAQRDDGDGPVVDVTFSDGRRGRYDLVVGADGQSSRTRRLALAAGEARFDPLGLVMAFYQVPRGAEDDDWVRLHVMPGGRNIFVRSANEEAPAQVYMSVWTDRTASVAADAGENAGGDGDGDGGNAVLAALGRPVAEQRSAFAAAYGDYHGWRVDELVGPLRRPRRQEDDDVPDFYAAEIGQVHCETLVKGRVVLLGDAGYCPSPITGMGTTLGVTGAYLLAGELVRRGGGGGSGGANEDEDNVAGALAAYERAVRPFVGESQTLFPGVPWAFFPRSRWGVWVMTTIVAVVARLRLIDLILRLMPDSAGGLEIPEYPELNLET